MAAWVVALAVAAATVVPVAWANLQAVRRAETGLWWFWAVHIDQAVASDSGTAETREAAMLAFKAQWQQVRRR